MTDPYFDREQTKTKHFILKHYLEALAFKVLRYFDITYVDGFSGPWKTETENFSDSSFMIAISVLQNAQQKIFEQTGRRPTVRCFFSENNRQAFSKLSDAVRPFHKPENQFEIKTYCGKFEDAIADIETYIARSFALIFIDPTGWSGYPIDKIKVLFQRQKCEVLINFMYDFVNRAAAMSDPKIVASLEEILGGAGWRNRLNSQLPKGRAVEQLFRDTLREAGNFDYVISTKIDRPTADRPHFFIVYGTKSSDGLDTFRAIEYRALKGQARDRANAKERKKEARIGARDLFADIQADLQEASIDEIIGEHKKLATDDLLKRIEETSLLFHSAWTSLLQSYMIRVTNVKDICVELAKENKIENTWGSGNRKPKDSDVIRLKTLR